MCSSAYGSRTPAGANLVPRSPNCGCVISNAHHIKQICTTHRTSRLHLELELLHLSVCLRSCFDSIPPDNENRACVSLYRNATAPRIDTPRLMKALIIAAAMNISTCLAFPKSSVGCFQLTAPAISEHSNISGMPQADYSRTCCCHGAHARQWIAGQQNSMRIMCPIHIAALVRKDW